MKFKVGDKVRFKSGDYVPLHGLHSNAEYCKEYGYDIQKVYEVKEAHEDGIICEGIGSNTARRFELAEQPKPAEPQVGDVWGSEDKSKVVRVLGKFERNGFHFVSYLGLKGECKGVANFARKSIFFDKFPTLLHRPPKKQPKPKVEQPKKQKKKWITITVNGEDYFQRGNEIKYVAGRYSGLARCNKNDKFDVFFGADLAWHRARIKYHEAKIAEMLGKEGVK